MLVVALAAVLLGIAGQSMSFARILFFVLLAVFLAGLAYSLAKGERPKGA